VWLPDASRRALIGYAAQFENPMISLSENIKVGHDYFTRSERLRMLVKRRMVSSEWRMGRRADLSLFAYQRPESPLPAEQVLENAQNGKG
jgi:hypothetical protein